MTTYREEIEAMMAAHNAPLVADSYRRSSTIAHFVRFDHSAAVIAAKAALAESRARVAAARAALHAAYSSPPEIVNPLMTEWRRLDSELRAMSHTRPPEGSIREHASRWLHDPSEENRLNLALFIA